MKKSILARGFIGSVASLLGVMAVGCSSEPLSPEEAAEIGVTEQALGASSAEASLNNAAPDDQRAAWSASCAFKDASGDYLVKAGGFDATPAATSKIWMQKDGGSWVTQAATLSAARGQSKAFRLSDTACVIVAGSTVEDAAGGSASAAIDLLQLTVSGANRIVSRTALASLNAARSLHELSTCVDNNGATHIVAVGGIDQGAGTPELRSVEVSPTLANITNPANTWTLTANVLTNGLYDFGMDTDGSNNYLIAGGLRSGGRTNAINLFKATGANGSCTISAAVTPATVSTISASLEGNVVFFDSSDSKFHVIAGKNGGSSLFANEDVLTATFGVTPDVTVRNTVSTPANFVPTYRPTFLRIDSSKVLLMGGANGAVNAAIAKVQEYNAGWTVQNMGTGIYGGSAAILTGPNPDQAWIAAGYNTPGTLGVNTESYTVP